MAAQDVIVTRPSELHIAPTFQANVHEVPVNLYRLKVNAQSFDSRRMSFTWRAPGNRLLASPQAYLEFELVCHVPYIMTEAECMSAVHGLVDRGGFTNTQTGYVAETVGTSVSGGTGIRADYLDYVGAKANALGLLNGAKDAIENPNKAGAIPGSSGYRAALAFGEGDAVGNCIESIQYTINGCSLSHQNWHLFKRSLDRCFMPSRVMQRCFYSCGGAWNAYDVKAISGAVSRVDHHPALTADLTALALVSAPASACVEGFTTDSGLARRMKNVYGAMCDIESIKVGSNFKEQYPGTYAENKAEFFQGTSFVLRIKVPLSGALFNPVWGETGLSRSCPYQRLPLAIPNLNQGSLTILFKDLEKSLIRRLGRTLSRDIGIYGTLVNNSECTDASNPIEEATLAANAITITDNAAETFRNVPFTILLRAKTTPTLHLQYLRLQSFRAYPEVSQFATYRTQTYLGPMMETGLATGMVKSETEAAKFTGVRGKPLGAFDQEQAFLKCSGADLHFRASGVKREPSYIWEVSFDNLQFAQPPTYLFICAQKSSECYSHQSPLVALNEDDMKKVGAQLNLARAKIGHKDGVKTASANQTKATRFAGRYMAQNQDSNLAIIKLALVVQSSVGTFEISGDKYPFLRDQQNIWDQHKRNCNAEYYADGGFGDWQKRGCCVLLSVSQYLHGLGSSAGVAFPIQISATVTFENKCAFIDGLYANDPAVKGTMVWKDYIRARPVIVGIFDKQVIQIASSSAVLSALNMSQNNLTAALSSRP